MCRSYGCIQPCRHLWRGLRCPGTQRYKRVGYTGPVSQRKSHHSVSDQEGSVERLTHAGIQDIYAISWRPNSKDALAVAHSGGVSVWTCELAGPSPGDGALSSCSACVTRLQQRILHRGRTCPLRFRRWHSKRCQGPWRTIKLAARDTAVRQAQSSGVGERPYV